MQAPAVPTVRIVLHHLYVKYPAYFSALSWYNKTQRNYRAFSSFISIECSKTSDGMAHTRRTSVYQPQLRGYSRRLEMLHETALRINQAESAEQVYTVLLEQLRPVVRYDSASVLLVDGDSLRVVAFTGFPQDFIEIGLRFPLTEHTPSLDVVRLGKPMHVRDMLSAYPHFAEGSPITAAKIVSWLGAPLIWKGKTIGHIALDRWYLEPFADDDLRLATTIASHAAGAIERIRLHNQVLESNEQLEQRVTQRTGEIEQAQSAIRNLVERLELATSTAGIGVWDWDLVNGAVFLDQSMRALFRLPLAGEQEEVFRDWLSHVHPDDRQRLEASILGAMHGEKTITSDFRLLAPGESERHIHSLATVFYAADGQPQRIIGVCTDVTKARTAEALRQQIEENLRKSEEHLRLVNIELERIGKLKDEFLANMSHELRTPLNAILILGESLQDEVYGPVNSRQRQALNDVVESGQHLLALINDILDLSKIEAGKVDLQMSEVNIANVCQASLRLVRELATQKRQVLSILLPADTLHIWADERRLKQMLVNLLSNAVKFTPDEGRIGLEVNSTQEHNELCFTVWDTGIGIPADRLPHLFQPFAQLDSALNRQYGGTGLGLALVRRLAELHGGRVEVQSEVGVGTRFAVFLPTSTLICPEPSSTKGFAEGFAEGKG